MIKMGPLGQNRLAGIGSVLQQLSAGQPVDVSGFLDRQDQILGQQKAAEQFSSMQAGGLLERFSPEQRQVLMSLPPEAAQRVIADVLFAPAPEPTATFSTLGPDQAAAMGLPAGGAYQINDLTGAIEQVAAPVKPEGPTASVRDYEYARAQGYTGSFQEWETENRRAGATSINMGGGSDKQIFDEVKASADAARAAATGLAALTQAKAALDGGAITGVAANQRLYLQKLGAALGITDPAAVQNTETFRAAIAPQVASLMKATVGSTQISNADREFAEKAAGGAITLDEGSIKRLIGIMERASMAAIASHNDRLNAVYPDAPEYARERALFAVPAPQITVAPPRPDAPPPDANAYSGGVPQLAAPKRLRFNPDTGELE